MTSSRAFSLSLFMCWLALFSVSASHAESGDSSDSPCSGKPIVSTPTRPTLSTATDVTQCGTLEAEYGFERQWIGGGSVRNDLTGGLRFGIAANLDFRWASSDYLNLSSPGIAQTGFGDTWLGLKYRYLSQTKVRPSMGLSYTAKIPSADAARGLGSGQFDHSLAFLFSRDVHPFHFDFNAIPELIGRPGGQGYDHHVGFALANWLTATKQLSVVAEPYGYTALNSTTPAFSSVLAGASYQVTPRLVLDTGFDVGVTHYAPRQRISVGITCAMGNLYSLRKPAH